MKEKESPSQTRTGPASSRHETHKRVESRLEVETKGDQATTSDSATLATAPCCLRLLATLGVFALDPLRLHSLARNGTSRLSSRVIRWKFPQIMLSLGRTPTIRSSIPSAAALSARPRPSSLIQAWKERTRGCAPRPAHSSLDRLCPRRVTRTPGLLLTYDHTRTR